MDRPTVKPPSKGAQAGTGAAAPTSTGSSIPTARIRLTSKEPPPLDADETGDIPPSQPSKPLAIISEEVTYNRRADARVDDDE